ncbi:MAG: chitobiase/beta-hexosaminidase C-terminal domain-containing protein [Opitutales bacterium]|nr:chitobiase/beta-hexosaminidase C-terminal domain-containing protein [Opitutales bacterium]
MKNRFLRECALLYGALFLAAAATTQGAPLKIAPTFDSGPDSWTNAAGSDAASPVVWLRADEGLILDDEGRVLRWEDRSGNNNHFEQPVAAKRPRALAEGMRVNVGDLYGLSLTQTGNTTTTRTLGNDFLVDEPIEVTHLAAFDDGGNGFTNPITVQLWLREDNGTLLTPEDDTGVVILEQITFLPEDPGTLEAPYRWKALETPRILEPGSYSIVAWGYTSDSYTTAISAPPSVPGVRWVGNSRHSSLDQPGVWPTTIRFRPDTYAGAMNLRYRPLSRTATVRPAVQFDGVDDGLLAPPAFDLKRPNTVLIVYERDTPSSGVVIQNNGSPNWYIRNTGFNSGGWVRNFSFDWHERTVAAMTQTATHTRAYWNLSDVTRDSDRPTGEPGRLAIGGGEGSINNPLAVRIAEVIAFDRVLSASELRALQAGLGERYGIFDTPAATPEISPVGGFGTGEVTVTLESATTGAEIRYTTDGSEPTLSSPLYSGPFVISRGTTVQARAYHDDTLPSEVARTFYGEESAADNLPLTGATLWLRADQGIEMDAEGGVLRWRDLSGQGNDMVQPLAEKRPVLTTHHGHGIIVPVTTASNSTWGGSLGKDFDVDETITLTHLGAYDHNRDGFGQTITVQLWSRNDGGVPNTRAVHSPGELLAERTFTPQEPGTLEGMMRFKALDESLDLPPGAYTIFAWGFTNGDLYWLSTGNSASGSDGRFRFLGDRSSGSSAPGAWPGNVGVAGFRYNGVANFKYLPRPGTPEPVPLVTFDGVDDGLIGVESMNIDRPSTVVMSFRRDRSSSGFIVQNTSDGSWYIRNSGFYSNNWVSNENIPVQEPLIAAMLNGEGFTRAWLNGQDITTEENRPGPNPGRLALGGGEGQATNATAVSIGEVIAFDRVLDESELWLIEDFLTRRHRAYDAPVALPVITPPSGFGAGPVEVTMATATPGASLHYTLDGTEPTPASALYEGPFTVSRGTTVRARAFLNGVTPSPVASAFFGEEAAIPLPVADTRLWLRSDIGVETDSEGRVRSWRDLSGNDYRFIPPTLAQAPVLTTGFAPTRVLSATTAFGASGGTTYSGFIGTDFIVDEPIEITHLGAFDHLSDGFAGTITVRLHIVDDNGTPDDPADDFSGGVIATQTFGPGKVGFLEGGTRFIELDEPLLLEPGRYNLESSGWIGADSYTSQSNWPKTSGRGVTFPDLSRFGSSALFGASRLNDSRYASATPFIFRPAGTTVETFPTVRFDGDDDGLLGPDDLVINRPSTIFAVFNLLGGSNGRLIQSNSNNNWVLGPNSGSNANGFLTGSWVAQHSISADEPSWVVGVQDTDSSRYFYNGTDLTEDSVPTGELGRIALGGGAGWSYQPVNADLVELIAYDRVLSEAERQLVGAYLADRYSLPRELLTAPEVTPDGGLYASARTVSVSHPIPGAEIRYTLDGSDPDQNSPLYTGPLSITADTLLKTRAYADGFLPGVIRESAFYLDASTPLPPSREKLQLWLSASLGAETDDAGTVTIWRDLSGNARNATQLVANQRPLLDSAAVGGAPGLVFDGSNDHLVLPEGFADFDNGLTAIFVVRTETTGANQRIIDLGRGQNTSNIFFGRSASSTSAVYGVRGAGNNELLAPNTYLSAADAIYSVTHDASGNVRIFHNGSLIAEDNGFTIQNIFRPRNFVGRSNWNAHAHFSGAIAEVLLYDGTLDDFARETFEDALRARHGIATSATGSVAFSPSPANLYPSGVEVSLASVTEGARIHYTLDGSIPDETSPLYSEPFFLGGSTRVRARAFADDLNPGQLTEATYLVGQPPSSGDGLLGAYFNTVDLTGPSFTRVDAQIDFNWGSGSPDPSINNNLFSIRWTGQMMPRFTETYTFFSNSNDGMRVWIELDNAGDFNNEEELILDYWINQNQFTERVSGPVNLVAGQLYNIRVEYYDNSGTAAVALRWESFSEPKAIIPQSQLFSDAEFNQTVATPVITPPGGLYTGAIHVGLTTATPSATIRYTTNGSEPTPTSPVYTGPFEIGNDATIRARAFRSGFNPSGIATAAYIIDASPPLITSFQWENEGIEDDDVFIRRGTFSTTATDDQGIHSAEFFYRPIGSSSRTLIGRDTTPANGLTAAWNIAAVPDGEYEVIVRVFAHTGIWSEVSHTITVALAVPEVPAITQPISGISLQEPVMPVRVEAEPGTNLRLSRNGQFVFAGYANNNGVLIHNASLADGLNTFTAVTRNRAGDSAPSNAVEVTRVREFPQLVLVFDGDAVGEGLPVTGNLSIPQAEPADLFVQITTNRPGRFDNIPPVIIPAGSTSVPIVLEARQDSIIQAPTTVDITTSAPAYRNAVVQLHLLDDDYPTLTLELAAASVSEDVGIVQATVRRSPVSDRSVRVDLLNTKPSRVTIPSFVTIPSHTATATFNINVIDNDIVDGNAFVGITGEVSAGGFIVATSNEAILEVRDNDGAVLSLDPARPTLSEGGSAVNVVLRRVGTATGESLPVSLFSQPAGQLTHPAMVTIPAGAAQVSFAVSAPANATTHGTRMATLRGGAEGFTDALTTFTVTDQAKADLAASQLFIAPDARTEEYTNVTYRVDNFGFAPAEGPFLERIFLSPTPSLGPDALPVRQIQQTGEVLPGSHYFRDVSVLTPRPTGNYYLIVVIDPGGAVPDLNRDNNTAIRLSPINIRAAYSATVQAFPDVVPANTPVTFTGLVTNELGEPAPFAMVNIHIVLGETERVIAALSNSVGEFSTQWTPLRNEGGLYTLGATHPGTPGAQVQGTLEILTLGVEPPSGQITLNEGSSAAAQLILRNPNERPLTGISIDFPNLPPGLTILADTPTTEIAPGHALNVPIALSAASGVSGSGTFPVFVTTAEGVEIETQIRVRINLLQPSLSFSPNALNVSVLRGVSRSESIQVTNTGGLETGPVQISLPDLPWLKLASANPMPSIPPGGSASISFNLAPDANVPLTLFTGTLGVNPANGGDRPVNYRIRTVSDLRSDLAIEVVNEFFFFTEAAPKLEGATVSVRDAISTELIASVDTDTEGLAFFPELNEGWYRIEVSAPEHDTFSGNYYVNAGELNQEQIFISRRMVRYFWSVEEVETEDVYRATLRTTFETNVPAPVVVATPNTISVGDLENLGDRKTINVALENHGFIAAENAEFLFSDHPFYDFAPLVRNIGTIPAKSSIVVPVTITRTGVFAEDGSIILLEGFGSNSSDAPLYAVHSVNTVPCGAGSRVDYEYPCGHNVVTRAANLVVVDVVSECSLGEGGPVELRPAFFSGIHLGVGRRNSVKFASVDPCLNCWVVTAVDCAIGYTPAGCPWAIGRCIFSGDVLTCGGAAFCWTGPIGNTVFCGLGALDCIFDFSPSIYDLFGLEDGEGLEGYIFDDQVRGLLPELATAWERLETVFHMQEVIYGSREMVLMQVLPAMETWLAEFGVRSTGSTDAERTVNPTQIAELEVLAVGLELSWEPLHNAIERWNRTIAYYAGGIHNLADVPAGESTNFIPRDLLAERAAAVVAAAEDSESRGFADPFEEYLSVYQALSTDLLGSQEGACARVTIELSQDVVMTRTAFLATLELENEREDPLEGVTFDFRIRDQFGLPAEDLFNLQITRLTGLAAIDGSDTIGSRAAGTAQWTLIPRDTAALESAQVYTIGGTIRYVQNGVQFNIPVQNVPITVRPDASLALKYFHQRDVFSNDPYTDVIEPAQPFKLAVLVRNNGFGEARNLRILSGQPEIVENETDLFIDFKVIGTEVEGVPLSPSLTADFGTLGPQESKVAVWQMTSTLQGLFVDYEATFEHVTGLGDPRISLMESVEIHEMIRLIRDVNSAPGTTYAFLTNDIPDLNNYPDTLHFVDGETVPVTVRETGTFSNEPGAGQLSVTLHVAAFAGWSYIRLPDPGNGAFRLVSVTRSDGRTLPIDDNAWLSDRTFVGRGQRPVYENILHLVDADSSGSYTLLYEPKADADLTPPESTIAALPPVSPREFPVSWNSIGTNPAATFDIFVSIDDAPYFAWRTATSAPAGMFIGSEGSSYRFYSIARTSFGILESKSPVAEATTIVGMPNQPPVLNDIANRTIPAGETLRVFASAIDPDGDINQIRFSIGSNRTGVTIDPVSGEIRWNTSLADAGKTAAIIVTATDGGSPPASAQTSFEVTVEGVNRPPVIDPVGPQTIQAGGILIVDVDATDNDFPAQTLTFSLDTAPTGMFIHPVSGVLQWSPNAEQAGQSYPVTVRVTDNGTPPMSATLTFSVNVVAPPAADPPFFSSIPVVLWLKGRSHSLDIFAVDPGGQALEIEANLSSVSGAVFDDFGDGSARLQWDTSAAGSGLYHVPVTTTARGLTSSGSIRIRVEEDNLYWSWVEENFGTTFPQDFDLALLDKDADPDGDGRPNVHEMALLTNPLGEDSAPVRLEISRSGNLQLVNLRFDRRTGSQNFVDFRVRRAASLGGPWEVVPPSQIFAYLNRRGNEDGRPETETVDFDVPELHPNGFPERSFYRIETIQKMNEE